jgi:hypothetical protein
MKLGTASLWKIQINPCRILNIHIQTAEALSVATHFRRPSQEPEYVVKFVGTIQQDSPA